MDDIRSYGAIAMMDALGIDAAIAEQVANEIAYRLSEHWDGSMIYITKTPCGRRVSEIMRSYRHLQGIISMSWLSSLVCPCNIFIQCWLGQENSSSPIFFKVV
ncbi:hypothetical protein LU290_04995 [Moraxella nasibovis]|uniref:Mor transcription activator family protein n=1 Tax=Moraxella nasibovis TaxID=2904120 RepID=UPI00240F2253|nr:Mor transcription activator family protein [Moraxella nasibovis]WFF39577.1 hypothetical protein LU290_04995 [Moraxella nasibovis]